MSRPAAIQRRLDELTRKPINYDPEALDPDHPPRGWNVDNRFADLPAEPPGPPVQEGSWEIAGRLIRGYEFADPSVVRAFYDPQTPLAGRNMLLELRALGRFSIHVGVRVGEVYEETRRVDNRQARVFGWNYRTLEGHVEQGQMAWEVWKWIDTGQVQFHVYAVSRTARIANPVVAIGFRLLRRHERGVFLDSTERRMVSFTELGLRREGRGERVREASGQLVARSLSSDDPAHGELARHVDPAEGELANQGGPAQGELASQGDPAKGELARQVDPAD